MVFAARLANDGNLTRPSVAQPRHDWLQPLGADVRTTVKHQGEADGTDAEVALRLERARHVTSRPRPLRYSKVLS